MVVLCWQASAGGFYGLATAGRASIASGALRRIAEFHHIEDDLQVTGDANVFGLAARERIHDHH